MFPYRANLYWDSFATIRGGTFHPGSTVSFLFAVDMADATTALSETADVDAVALSDTTASITPLEYGSAALPTAKVRATAFFGDNGVDRVVSNIIGRNAASSQDKLARTIIAAGSNVTYATGGSTDPTSRATVEANDTLTGFDIAKVVGLLRAADVPGLDGDLYGGHLHPHVGVDLRQETDASGWLTPANYSDASRRWRGEIGTFNGVRFVESSRAVTFADTGSPATVDVYGTVILGEGGIGKAWSDAAGYSGGATPTVVRGLPVDKLMRFFPIGWKWFGQYGILRETAVRRIESGSSLGT